MRIHLAVGTRLQRTVSAASGQNTAKNHAAHSLISPIFGGRSHVSISAALFKVVANHIHNVLCTPGFRRFGTSTRKHLGVLYRVLIGLSQVVRTKGSGVFFVTHVLEAPDQLCTLLAAKTSWFP